jgi:hypothetical protein
MGTPARWRIVDSGDAGFKIGDFRSQLEIAR